MASIGTYRINEKKCATCRYWTGDRGRREFVGTRLHRIKPLGMAAPCMAGDMKTPGNYCSKWDLAPELR